MILDELVEFSNRYGRQAELVLAGGGNTSAKQGNTMYVKASGTALATITADGFVKMDRTLLADMFNKKYPETDADREAQALADLMGARLPGEDAKRPSVETTLHSLFPQTFVLHLHPALVNGLTCGRDGEKIARELFGDDFLWVGICRPGYILAKLCCEEIEKYTLRTGKKVSTVILQNHGIFIAADCAEELDAILNKVMSALAQKVTRQPDLSASYETSEKAEKIACKVNKLYSENSCVIYDGNAEARRFAQSLQAAAPLMVPFTPDHIVYCKAFPLFVKNLAELDSKFEDYKQKHGVSPKIIIAEGLGFFAAGLSEKDAKTAQMLFNDAIKVAVYSESFGGPLHMTEELVDFIINWEVESYRQKQN